MNATREDKIIMQYIRVLHCLRYIHIIPSVLFEIVHVSNENLIVCEVKGHTYSHQERLCYSVIVSELTLFSSANFRKIYRLILIFPKRNINFKL